MNKGISKYLLLCILVLGMISWWQQQRIVHLGEERDRYHENTEALLSDMKRIQVDSATMAVDVKSLRLTVDEYKRLRGEDAQKIKELGIRLKNLKAAARHEFSVNAPIQATVRDSIVVQDSVAAHVQTVSMITPYIQLSGVIEQDSLIGSVHLPVVLRQAIWIEYKRKWLFWKKVKAVHQIITTDNPYVEVKYSEFINIQK